MAYISGKPIFVNPNQVTHVLPLHELKKYQIFLSTGDSFSMTFQEMVYSGLITRYEGFQSLPNKMYQSISAVEAAWRKEQ